MIRNVFGVLSIFFVFAAIIPGWSNETPAQTIEEVVALRKSKDDAMNKRLNPTESTAAPKAKSKGEHLI